MYSQDELRVHWNARRAGMDSLNGEGRVRDGERLLLWVPFQYRLDINCGTKLVIDARARDTVRQEVDCHFLQIVWKALVRYLQSSRGDYRVCQCFLSVANGYIIAKADA